MTETELNEAFERFCTTLQSAAYPQGNQVIIALYPGKSELAVKLAKRLALESVCQPLLLGPELAIFDLCVKHHVNPDSLYGIVDPAQPVNLASHVGSYKQLHPEATDSVAIAALKKPSVFAEVLIVRKEADAAFDLEMLSSDQELK